MSSGAECPQCYTTNRNAFEPWKTGNLKRTDEEAEMGSASGVETLNSFFVALYVVDILLVKVPNCSTDEPAQNVYPSQCSDFTKLFGPEEGNIPYWHLKRVTIGIHNTRTYHAHFKHTTKVETLTKSFEKDLPSDKT